MMMMIIDDNDEQFSSYYEYWGNCLKFLEANCRGDSYYEERVYSHQFDGVYYCPWQFPGILKTISAAYYHQNIFYYYHITCSVSR